MPKLEVRRVTREVQEFGYAEPAEKHFQQLGYATPFGGFHVLEEEVLPSDIVISRGCFGTNGREWESKFANWIPKAQGGRAEDFENRNG